MGDITVELFKDQAPVSVENFLRYATEGFYPGTIFHRVVKGFVVQGGGYLPGMVEKPTHAPIQNEATNGLKNIARHAGDGADADAAQRDLAVLHQRREQLRARSPRLSRRPDFGYAVFGRVLSGMEVADKIADVPTKAENPIEPVTIKAVTVK